MRTWTGWTWTFILAGMLGAGAIGYAIFKLIQGQIVANNSTTPEEQGGQTGIGVSVNLS